MNYGYKDRYLFEGNFRMMVRLVLPKEIVGVFSHHSLPDGVLSEEEFMKDIPWIYNLKLRASWGQFG